MSELKVFLELFIFLFFIIIVGSILEFKTNIKFMTFFFKGTKFSRTIKKLHHKEQRRKLYAKKENNN